MKMTDIGSDENVCVCVDENDKNELDGKKIQLEEINE